MVDLREIKRLLKLHFLIDRDAATINEETGLVDVNGSVALKNVDQPFVTNLPVSFGKVSGDFFCVGNQLLTLEGAPIEVGGDFRCYLNQLKNLKGAPRKVGGSFRCQRNILESLDGSPDHIGQRFFLTYSPILPLLKSLVARSVSIDARANVSELQALLNKHAGQGRRAAFSAAREIVQLGERTQQLQGLDHNPFEANARW